MGEAREPAVVHFLPEEREAPLDPSRTLLELAREAGVELAAPCGGKGRCGKCRVVVSGPSAGGEDEEALAPGEMAAGVRLACRCRPLPGARVEVAVPETSRPARFPTRGPGFGMEGAGPFEPRPPVGGGKPSLGVALDLGTSTLAGALVGLDDGRVLARGGCDNPQMPFGEDVISRIVHSEGSPGGLFRLQELLLQGVDGLIASLLADAGNPAGEVREVAVGGNTVVSYFLHGLDPAPLRRPPYRPPVLEFPERIGSQLGSSYARGARWRTFPILGGFVGGDVVAGLLACGIQRMVEPSLFFDLGTNGEVVLGSRDFLIACSSASGPVFEGGEVRSGVRALSGAIDSVWVDGGTGEAGWTTVGGAKPVGLCGSGILDLASELFRAGLLDRGGRLVARAGAPFRQGERGVEYIVVGAEASGTREPIVFDEADARSLLRTKASLCAAGDTLLAAAGMGRSAVRKVFISGRFGEYFDIRSALRLGAFPPFPAARFVPLGNASLAGAIAVLRAPSRWMEAVSLAHAATFHDLASDPAFNQAYQRALFIPHLDAVPYQRALAGEGYPS